MNEDFGRSGVGIAFRFWFFWSFGLVLGAITPGKRGGGAGRRLRPLALHHQLRNPSDAFHQALRFAIPASSFCLASCISMAASVSEQAWANCWSSDNCTPIRR